MEYRQLWDRWIAITILSEEDRQDLVEHLHEEITSGVTALATLANAQMGKLLSDVQYGKAEEYLKSVAPVTALAALDGYFLSLMERGINPQKERLSEKNTTKGLAKVWSTGHEKDQNRSYIDKIDSVIVLMLERIFDLRVNQILSFHPDIVEQPYKITEKLHQYIGWAVYQGYVLGVIEQEVSQKGSTK